MITTQQELTDEARRLGYRPEALVQHGTLGTIQLTSWPYFETVGLTDTPLVMARTVPGDAGTNRPVHYFGIVRLVGTMAL